MTPQNERLNILEALDHKIKICKDAKFTGKITVEINFREGGITKKYISDRVGIGEMNATQKRYSL